ncbi:MULTISPECIES: TonB-dependent receptor [unclassified Duganella]|uniref:TonB-dependent receptor n=1 Tax=unclassified Duganella TaxID=2636909 RepID=UPI00088DCA93|nr:MULTISPECIES: TonB-dependent receptor [unclassified Duganella]SDF76901.1 iron complex outermembrane recepter protein [Duganella sp. OV458]SDI52336.1 iron complex outermembrane recepter protein [Duganella sp. OV510]
MVKATAPAAPKLLVLSLSLSLMLTGTVHAQLKEVVVTAQRSPSLESRTPVSMTTLSAEQLNEAGIDSPAAIGARLPNVELDNAADGLRITMRGVSNADTTEKGDPSAAFLLDGIYIARPQIQNLSFYDLERVEVLRGPQGTLYGRNTTAGLVNVISKAPVNKFEAWVATEIGNYNSRKASAMLNVPVNDVLALRAALSYNRHDSYLTNAQGTKHDLGKDRDDLSARLSAKWKITRDATLLLRYDHSKIDDNNDSFVPDTNFYSGIASGCPVWRNAGTSAQLTNAFVPPNALPEQGYSHKTTSGVGADLSWDLGGATLYYLGAHRSYEHDALANFYYRVAPTLALGVRQNFSGDYTQNSHELRLATNGDGALSAQAGLYYFRESSSQTYAFRDLQAIGLPPYYVFPHGPTIASSKAIFGQATYRLTDKLRATAGARYTEDRKSRVGSTNFQQGAVFNPATDIALLNAASLSTHQTTWRLGVDYDLAPSALLYASLSTGYKAGGFNDGCLAGSTQLGLNCPAALAVPADTLLYQPETVRAYEAGVKTRFWENRANLNLSAFHYDYRNLQLSGVAIVAGAPRFVTANAGEASVKGLEAEGQVAITPRDRISYALALLDAHYVRYSPDGLHDWAGNKLDRSPAHTLSLGYEHSFRLPAGELAAGVRSRRSASSIIAVPTQLLQYRIPAYTESEATLHYRPNGAQWSVLARVKNIENKVRPIAIDSFGMTVPGDPRTVDVRLDYRF